MSRRITSGLNSAAFVIVSSPSETSQTICHPGLFVRLTEKRSDAKVQNRRPLKYADVHAAPFCPSTEQFLLMGREVIRQEAQKRATRRLAGACEASLRRFPYPI